MRRAKGVLFIHIVMIVMRIMIVTMIVIMVITILTIAASTGKGTLMPLAYCWLATLTGCNLNGSVTISFI